VNFLGRLVAAQLGAELSPELGSRHPDAHAIEKLCDTQSETKNMIINNCDRFYLYYDTTKNNKGVSRIIPNQSDNPV